MSFFASPAQVWAGMIERGLHVEAEAFKVEIEAVFQKHATILADSVAVDTKHCKMEEHDFGGLLIAFRPRSSDQPIPKCLEDFDAEEEWKYD